MRRASVDDVYAVTAYILNLNDLVDDDFVLSRSNFKDIEMPIVCFLNQAQRY